jgi:hypothetical protein
MFKVGDKVKIVHCQYDGRFKGKTGVVTSNCFGLMVSSQEGLPEHYYIESEFHLYFNASDLQKYNDTEALALFDWANQ